MRPLATGCLLVALFAWGAIAPSGEAAFPGANGKLAFTSARDGHYEVYVSGADGSNQTNITNVALADAEPVWSPDGEKIAFASGRDLGSYEIYVMNADGSNPTRLTNDTTADDTPAWSPDGSSIAFSTSRDNVANEIYVMDADGGNPTRLTNNTALDTAPAWSPDGTKIAFRSERDGNYEIYVMDADGENETNLTDNDVYDNGPSWSPDGSKIAFASTRDGAAEIYTMNPDGTNPDRITENSFEDIDPAWSPDGERIAFTSKRDAGDQPEHEIWVMNADGSDQVRLTNNAQSDLWPDWQPIPAPVGITAGPAPVAGTSSATFEFLVIADPVPAGHFECRIDDGEYATCSSPHEVVGLADGEHTFYVRYVRDEGGPGPPASRTWTVDTTAPTVQFDQVPPAQDASPNATFAWSASEADVTFVCALEPAPLEGCSSPLSFLDLADGQHVFAVQATDAAGNVSEVARHVWTVAGICPVGGSRATTRGAAAGCPPPPPECPAGASSSVTEGPFVAVARGGPGSCFTPRIIDGVRVMASPGPVSWNGIPVSARPGSVIALGRRAGNAIFATTGASSIDLGPGPWDFEEGFEFTSAAQNVISRELSLIDALRKEIGVGTLKFGPFSLAISPKFKMSTADGGRTEIGLTLGLPENVLASGPKGPETVSPGGTTAEFTAIASNDRGIDVSGRLGVSESWLLGKWKLKDVSLGFDTAARTFDGSASVEFGPDVPGVSRRKATIAIAFGPEPSIYPPLRKASLSFSGFAVPIGGSFIWRRVAVAAEFDPTALKIKGSMGGSIGPEVLLLGEIISLDGEGEIRLPKNADPWSVKLSGEGKVLDVPIANGEIRYVHGRRLELSGGVDLSISGFGQTAEIRDAWFGTTRAGFGFNVEARHEISLGFIDVVAEAVFSSNGWAVCVGPDGTRYGFGKRAGDPQGAVALVACDLAPYRTARPAQVGSPTTFTVPRGRRLLAVQATGAQAPPKVVLTGPGGLSIATPADGALAGDRDELVTQNPVAKTTTIMLRGPRPGRYTVTPLPGGPEPVSVRTTGELPEPAVRATVSRRGSRRILRWRLRPIPGQQVAFFERGAVSATRLARTNRRRGSVTFKPSATAGSAVRTIEAQIEQHGLPRSTVTVARYRVRTRPGRIRGVRRTRTLLRWRAAPAAASYTVVLAAADGSVSTQTVRRNRIRLRSAARRGRVTVTITPLDPFDRPGRPTRIRLR